jgi:hypothetical protein
MSTSARKRRWRLHRELPCPRSNVGVSSCHAFKSPHPSSSGVCGDSISLSLLFLCLALEIVTHNSCRWGNVVDLGSGTPNCYSHTRHTVGRGWDPHRSLCSTLRVREEALDIARTLGIAGCNGMRDASWHENVTECVRASATWWAPTIPWCLPDQCLDLRVGPDCSCEAVC